MFTVVQDDGADVNPEPEGKDGEAEAKTPEPEEAKENEAESPPADEQNVEKKSDPDPTDPKWYTDKIDKLTGRLKGFQRESERERAESHAEIERLRKELESRPIAREPAKTLADFDHDEDKYRDYLFTEAESRAEQTAERIAKGYQDEALNKNIEVEHADREKAFAATVDDYYDKVQDPSLRISPPMRDEIWRSDIGPQIAMKLAAEPELASEISRLPLTGVVRRMTILEMDLKAEMSKTAKTVSDAPPPPPQVKAGDPGLEKGYREEMSDAEFAKKRRKEIANR